MEQCRKDFPHTPYHNTLGVENPVGYSIIAMRRYDGIQRILLPQAHLHYLRYVLQQFQIFAFVVHQLLNLCSGIFFPNLFTLTLTLSLKGEGNLV